MSLKFFSQEDRVLKYVNRPTGAQCRPYYRKRPFNLNFEALRGLQSKKSISETPFKI